MKRQDMTFRITKIGKTAVSVAVCGLMAAVGGGAAAQTYNLADSANRAKQVNVDQGYVAFTYNINNNNNPAGNYSYGSGSITITLGTGVDLTGTTGIGSTTMAIYTLDTADGASTGGVTFSNVVSTLNLSGNNDIKGVVGWHFGVNDSTGTADPIGTINIAGVTSQGVTFNDSVYAGRIELNSGNTVSFLGNVQGNIDFNGNGTTVDLGSITLNGNIENTGTTGRLIFSGATTVNGNLGTSTTGVSQVDVNNGGATVFVSGNLSTLNLNYQSNATVRIGGNLDLNNANGVNAVTFNTYDGELQVAGDITGVLNKAVITTSDPGEGTVTMYGTSQTITGHVGTSTNSIKTLNIGGTGGAGVGNSTSSTNVSGDVFANTISLNNNSTLTMNSGYNLTGNVVTQANATGSLILAGGTQTVTGTVGASGRSLNTVSSGADAQSNSTFTGAIYATNVNNGLGTSTYQAAVTATNVDVNNGTAYFEKALTAATTMIGTGTGNFSGTTSTDIKFTGTGTAYLNKGLTGNIDFDGKAGTVNLENNQSISGTVTGKSSNLATVAGTLNVLGGGTLNGAVGKLSALNVNRFTANAVGDTTGATANTLVANASIDAASVKLFNDATLQLSDKPSPVNLTGAVTTTTNGSGSLTMLGSSTVTGNVGAAGLALKAINAGADSQTVTFNSGVVYANTLTYNGNGEVRFNGATTPVPGSPNPGFVGTVNFGNGGTGKLTLGDKVDLITQNAASNLNSLKTTFQNANGATLNFAGSSTVAGDLGSGLSLSSGQNFKEIYAGAHLAKVSFLGDVYVAATTFHVSGDGTVNFLGDLNGPLVYDANGTVNLASGKKITSLVSTGTNGQGTLNFVGSATTVTDIGNRYGEGNVNNKMLYAVNFHAATSDSSVLPVTAANETVNIGHNIYALTTNIGTTQNSNANATVANVTSNVFLGNALNLAGSNVTLNTLGSAVTTTDEGRLTNTATQSTTGTGAITTNGATLDFAIATTKWASNAGGTLAPATSSSITGGTGSRLVMNGSETVNLTLLGSLKNTNTPFKLINVAGGVVSGNTSLPATVNDNSYVIDTTLTRADGDGSLVVTASRGANVAAANNVYVTKSNTTGHFSNNAAVRLGTLAAAGTGYGQDMQTVFNKLDIDQWGYGNNQANLATQVKRLAPIANSSVGLSALALGSMVTNNIGVRMHELRNVPQSSSFESTDFWLKTNFLNGKQTATGDYDGYTSKLSGMSMGLDSRPDNSSIVGVAFSYGTGTVSQTQFRSGDQANLKSWQLSLYGAYDFTPELFVGGVLSMARQNTSGSRTTVVGRTAMYDADGTESGFKLDLGYRIKFDDSTTMLTPMLSVEDRTFKQNAYTETGAVDAGLNVAAQRLTSKQTGLGLRLSSTEYVGGMVVKPELAVFSMREHGQQTDPVSASFIGDTSATAFNTNVASYSPRSTKLSLGAGVLMSKSASLVARYQYVKRDTFSSNMAELIARWNF